MAGQLAGQTHQAASCISTACCLPFPKMNLSRQITAPAPPVTGCVKPGMVSCPAGSRSAASK